MGTWYCTREDVKSALDSKLTARDDAAVDRAIEAASRSVDALLRRAPLAPTIATRSFSWPAHPRSRAWRLWLDEHSLISVTGITAGGEAVTDYFLEPANEGPPYASVELDRSGSSSWTTAGTPQRAIAITGLWGWSDDSLPAGALAEALDATETAVDVTDGSAIGVGSVLRCDTERMVVTAKGWLDSTQNLGANLGASAAADTVAVATGSAFTPGEMILVDSERMLIVDVAGNNLVVKRGWDGSVLAAHTSGVDVYAQRLLTVTRGALGTTAATHLTAATLTAWAPPAKARALTIAEAITQVEQEQAGYGRTVGSGESEREARGAGLADLRGSTRAAMGRTVRHGAV